MAIAKFPKFGIYRTLDSSSSDEQIAAFTPDADIELKHIKIYLLRVGTAGGSETFTLKVHDTSAYNNVIDTSDTVTYSAIAGSDNYHFVRFDFNRKVLQGGLTYYLELETANYTRNGDTFYFAVQNESDSQHAANGSTADASSAIAYWYGHKVRS